MKPKTTILLVRLVCYFVYHCFVEHNLNLAKDVLDSLYELAHDQED